MEMVPRGGLCVAFPQCYLADLLAGIISSHRLFLIYILRASKLQEHIYSKEKPCFSGITLLSPLWDTGLVPLTRPSRSPRWCTLIFSFGLKSVLAQICLSFYLL